MNIDHLFDFLFVVVGAFMASLYPAFRNWRGDVKEEGASAKEQQTMAKAVARLELLAEQHKADIDGVAEANRILVGRVNKRIDRLKEKGAAIETAVTGRLPRVSGEGEEITNG